MERRGIRQAGAMAERRKLFGLLETTWHMNYRPRFRADVHRQPRLAACERGRRVGGSFRLALGAAHLRAMFGRDMGLHSYG
jgi:hypothetical protein